MMQRPAGLVAMAAALMAPAAIGQSKIAPPPPPYAGAYQPQGVDEIGLWGEGDEDERILANSPILLRDEALNAYVKGVLCATVGDDRCRSVRLYIAGSAVQRVDDAQWHDAGV